MEQNIRNIMDEFMKNSFWEIGKLVESNKSQLENFTKEYNIPDDFSEMLSITDGFVLFNAGDYRISDIDWTLQCKNNRKYNPGYKDEVLDVGYFMGYKLVINQTQSLTSSYLYAGDACSPDDYVCVGTITDFLNGFIEAKGEIPFWETENQEMYYILAE